MPSWQDDDPQLLKNVVWVLADHIRQHLMSGDYTPETLWFLSLDFLTLNLLAPTTVGGRINP